MKRKAILEYTVPEELTDYIERIGYPSDGGEMMRQLERINADYGRSGLYYAASLFAEHHGVSHVYIRLNDRVRVVNWDRGDDNEPTVTGDSQLDDDTREEVLMSLAEKDLIIPYLEDYWLERYEDDQESIYYRAAYRQRNGDSPGINVEIEPTQDTDAEVPEPDVEIEPTQDTDAEVPQDTDTTPTAPSNESALDRFANSGKGGLSNDPDEVEAIEELQEFLVELGLNVGNNGVDGRYGPRTTASVRQFQGAIRDVVQDGDAGPETIGAIREVQRDTARIQELVDILNESAVPFTYKSGLAALLERDLTQEERSELEQLLDKYEEFIQEFPDYQPTVFQRAQDVISGTVTAPSDTAPLDGPFVDGMAITSDVNNSLEAIGRDPGMIGERLTPEDIAALNQAVADGDIDASYLNREEQPSAGTQDLNWEEITIAPEDIQNERGVPTNTVVLDQGRGATMLFVPIDSINGVEFDYIDGDATGTPITVTGPEGLVFAINQEIERRNSESEVEPEVPQQQTVSSNVTDPEYTGNYRQDLVQFYNSEMSREDAEAFVASISLENKNLQELLDIQRNIQRVISVLNGNQRIPDAVGEPNGGQIINKPQAVAILRTFKDRTIMDAIRATTQNSRSPEQSDGDPNSMSNILQRFRGSNNGIDNDAINSFNAAGEN